MKQMGAEKFSLFSFVYTTIVFLVVFTLDDAFAHIVPECGTIDEVLAQHDLRAQVPWTAALYFQSTQCDFRPAGNGHGVIIGPTTVLIKGNFMWSNDGFGGIRMQPYSPNYFMIVAGLKSKLPFVADQYTQFLKVANIQPHYLSYDSYTEYDFAIVHLKNPIQFTSFVRPVCIDALPDGIFDRSNHSVINDHLSITGFRTGSGSFKSALHTDKEPFGLLSPEFCTSKLQWDLAKSSSAPFLSKKQTPCGISTKAVEDLIDVRSVVGSGGSGSVRGDISLSFLKQLLNFTKLEELKGYRPISNVCFHNGASVVTLYQGRWHLVGIVTESLGMVCDKNLYFVSFVASKNNLNWISQHLRYSSSSFVCSNGQTVHLENSLCNGEPDCEDGSDEDEKLCACSPMCSSNSNCFLQPMCKNCGSSESLKVLSQTYKFSNAVTNTKLCPPIIPPQDASVYCKAPGLKSRVPCERDHFVGTQAVFSCRYFDSSTPASYCVTTCQDNGKWTDELKSFQCKTSQNVLDPNEDENIFISERRNFSSSTNLITSTELSPSSTASVATSTGSITLNTMKYKDENGTVLCPPVTVPEGTQVSCWTTTSSKRLSCSEAMYPGSKAEFTCSRYYKSVLSTASVVKHCQPDGEWSLSSRNFECRLDCGIPKNDLIGHIVNGRETDGTKWPWHGLIFINLGQHNYTYICGSTLVSKRILITAAHCVTDRQGVAKSPSLYKAALAATSNIYHQNILDDEIQIFEISKIVVHSLFNPTNFEADIAILQLSRPIAVTDFVRPACFPLSLTGHTEQKHLSPGSTGIVVGFGYDETGKPSKTIKEASLPVVSYKDCFEVSKIQHSSTQYCAGYTNGTSVCNGDSGSGQFFEEEFPQKRVYLQGVVSHGNRDESSRLCDHNQYSVFTKVGSFKNWISETAYELDEEF